MSKSTITTQEAERLLAKGWILKQNKDPFHGHSFYIFDVNNKNYPHAKYINKRIAETLQRKGHLLYQNKPKCPRCKTEGTINRDGSITAYGCFYCSPVKLPKRSR